MKKQNPLSIKLLTSIGRPLFKILKIKPKKGFVYLVPKFMGFLYTFAILILLVVAGLNNSVALFAYTMLLVSLGIMTMLLTNSNLTQVAVEYPMEMICCEGQEINLQVLLRSKKGSECLNLSLECFSKDRSLGLVKQISILKNRELSCSIPICIDHCGIVVVDAIKVSSSYPLGLFRTWTIINSHIKLYAHPKPEGKNLQKKQQAFNDLSQEIQSHEKGSEPEDYYGLRAFRLGDSMFHVDWKAAARSRELLIKEWSQLESYSYEFNLNQVPEAHLLGKLRQLTLWVMQAEKHGASYSLHLDPMLKPVKSLTTSLKALTQYGHKHL